MKVFEDIRFAGRRLGLSLADRLVTAPLMRWMWTGLSDPNYSPGLAEFRPSDPEAVRDMMAGRYLLAFKMVDTGGASPFAVEIDHPDWLSNLHGFSWLRHFRDLRDRGSRGFARTLIMDWIGTYGQYDSQVWAVGLTAQRVMNWLRHLDLLLEDAADDQSRAIVRSLGAQIQSLRQRRRFAFEPVDRLLALAALVAAEIASAEPGAELDLSLGPLNAELAAQIDGDGLHLSRNPRAQLALLIELSSLRRSLVTHKTEDTLEFGAQIERMHDALDALTLGSGEPAYFNGNGQVAHDTLVALQAGGSRRRRRSCVMGGYGVLRDGEAVVIADSGLVPPLEHAGELHDSALAFEFSHGAELIAGSCGPAPLTMPTNRDLFRHALAHSAPSIDEAGAADLRVRGPLRGRMTARDPAEPIGLHAADHLMVLRSKGWRSNAGVDVERRLTLLSGGTTLVGQDRLAAAGGRTPEGVLALRFHLAPGVLVRRTSDGLVRLILPNGAVWSFLWEGASLYEDDSVRQSAYFGFQRTRQLVLEADVADGLELAWIFTREQG